MSSNTDSYVQNEDENYPPEMIELVSAPNPVYPPSVMPGDLCFGFSFNGLSGYFLVDGAKYADPRRPDLPLYPYTGFNASFTVANTLYYNYNIWQQIVENPSTGSLIAFFTLVNCSLIHNRQAGYPDCRASMSAVLVTSDQILGVSTGNTRICTVSIDGDYDIATLPDLSSVEATEIKRKNAQHLKDIKTRLFDEPNYSNHRASRYMVGSQRFCSENVQVYQGDTAHTRKIIMASDGGYGLFPANEVSWAAYCTSDKCLNDHGIDLRNATDDVSIMSFSPHISNPENVAWVYDPRTSRIIDMHSWTQRNSLVKMALHKRIARMIGH